MTQPRRADEVAIWDKLRELAAAKGGRQPGFSATLAAGRAMGMAEGRLFYLLEKWTRKGWWDWGMNPAGGWFTDDAPEALAP